MKSPEPPDRLSTSLRRLETRPTSADFTDRVLGALDARLATRRRRRRLAIALVLPAAAVLVATLVLWTPAPHAPRAAQLDELRRRQQDLQAELARLEAARDRTRAVLYLGTGDSYDLVLDLEPLLEPEIGTPIVPALTDLRAQPARVVEAARRPR